MKVFWWVAFTGLLLSFLVLTSLPQSSGEESSQSKTAAKGMVETVAEYLEQVPVLKNVPLSPLTIRKIIGHFLYCFLIAWSGFYCFATFMPREIGILRIMSVICLMISTLGETLQIFTLGRYPSITDVSINYSGALLGLFLAYFLKQKILTTNLGEQNAKSLSRFD